MKGRRNSRIAMLLTAAMIFNMSGVSYAGGAADSQNPENTKTAFAADSLTLQPGVTTGAINVNWYAPEGTTGAAIRFGEQEIDVEVEELTTPTLVNETKYTDTGKLVCRATVTGLSAGETYTYQVSNDGGANWSKEYTYTAPKEDEFKFAFTSDPQIKENQETNQEGWNPSDNTNQTGWAKMMETIAAKGATLVVSAGDQVEDQSWGKSSEYEAFFAPEQMNSIAYAPAVGNHDRHYMFADHFNLPNEMKISAEETTDEKTLTEVKTSFRGQNSGTSQSHGNYIAATAEEVSGSAVSNGVSPNSEGYYDFAERREMETAGNYYYLYNNVLFITLNTGAYPGGNDALEGEGAGVSSMGDNSEAEAIVDNFRKTIQAAKTDYEGEYDWIIVSHHKSTQTVAKHVADSDIENYVDAGFQKLMAEEDVDMVLAGHDHVYSRSFILDEEGLPNSERLNTINNADGVLYITGNCCSDMQYYTPFASVDKKNNVDYPLLANGTSGSLAYMAGKDAEDKSGYLPIGNQEYNQEYSPSYVLFEVKGDTITAKAYNLDGDSENPTSKQIDSFTLSKSDTDGLQVKGYDNDTASLKVSEIACYDSGTTNADGGVMEIVAYNEETGWAYAINGLEGNLSVIHIEDLENVEDEENIHKLDGNEISVKALVEKEGFTYGDMTSVTVSPDNQTLAVAIQDEDYTKNGCVAFFHCEADGRLTFERAITVGVQPDMVKYTPDGTKVLSADEGEPREGYTTGIDPKGSVSIIDTTTYEVTVVGFSAFTHEELVAKNIILNKDAAPEVDLEPEYIAANNKTAYVALQEANAIAVLNLETKEYTGIYSLGFEDYSKVKISLNASSYDPQNYETLLGVRMPDGISLYEKDGNTYLITANEGDSREWGDFVNEYKSKTSLTGAITTSKKVTYLDRRTCDGLDDTKDYIFGGRSFTMYQVTETGLTEIFDSGSEFEEKTAEVLEDYFNCSNDDIEVGSRSGKKGVEPESVTVGTIGDRQYAFIGLERIGGVMVYDITNPEEASYVNYINSRDFSVEIGTDTSPEGLEFVSADDSPTGKPMLLTACEVGGTVAVYEFTGEPQLGDVNQDGLVTAEDALDILKSVVGLLEADETFKTLGDMDGNGEITAEDALEVLKKVVGLI